MSQLVQNYRMVNEGKLSKSEFLRQARQSLPGYINQFTSYDDAIQILQNKGMLLESVEYVCPGDKFPLEDVENGIRYELEDILAPMEVPTPEQYRDVKIKVINNLLKDPLHYVKNNACCCDKCKQSQAEAEIKKGEDYKQKKTEGEMVEVEPGQAKIHLQENNIVTRVGDKVYNWGKSKKPYAVAAGAVAVGAAAGNVAKKGKEITDRLAAQGPSIEMDSKKKKEYIKPTTTVTPVEPEPKQVEEPKTQEPKKKEMSPEEKKAHNAKVRQEYVNSRKGSKLSEATEVGSREDNDKIFRTMYVKYLSEEYWEKLKAAGKAPARRFGPVEAAEKALNFVRKNFDKNYRPSRNAIADCAVGKYYMQFDAKTGKFNQSWDHEVAKKGDRMVECDATIDEIGDTRWGQSAMGRLARRKAKEGDKAAEQEIYDKSFEVADNMPDDKANLDFHYLRGRYFNMKENKVLKEAIEKSIVSVLSEAATTNLATLSDDNASIQGIPGMLNSLENIVTEIESFIIKEQEKIQGIFDNVGNIKNEDNIPIGHKFVEPIMNAFSKDLEPVLAKISLDNINLPEAPAPDETELQAGEENLVGPGIDDVASEETKETVFSKPREKREPLAEGQEKDTLQKALEGVAKVLGNVDGKVVCILEPNAILADVNNKLEDAHEPWRAVAKNKGAKFYLEPFKKYLAENKQYRYTK